MAYIGSAVPDTGVGIEQGSKGTKVFAFEELSGHSEWVLALYKALQFIQCSQESLEEYIINLHIWVSELKHREVKLEITSEETGNSDY